MERMPTLFIVDDEPSNLAVLVQMLKPHFQIRATTSGEGLLRALAAPPLPDLILLDIMMPGMDGHAVLRELRRDTLTTKIPVIFVTALSDVNQESQGLLEGADDYVTKPVHPTRLLARVRNQLALKTMRDWLADRNAVLEQEVRDRIEDTLRAETASIRALARLAETRDPETGHHILRTQAYVQLLALRLRGREGFEMLSDASYVDLLTRSAPLHDIGKVGIPDKVLLKPAALDAEEWAVMKTHTVLGSHAIEQAEEDLERPVPFLVLAKEIARSHHERWDGSGYPDGLVGPAIPVSARLMALADVFDALTSARVYKTPLSTDEARDIIRLGRGTHFDPAVVDAFESGFVGFQDIAQRFSESAPIGGAP